MTPQPSKLFSRDKCSQLKKGAPMYTMDLHPVLDARINDLDLHPALEARINDFLKTEFDKFLEKGLVFEYEILLHDARMADVCESIKAHYHWLHFGEHFPEFALHCHKCGEHISPEFDRRRHLGRCKFHLESK